MPLESLRCPTCGAADNSRADARGIHTCSYCNVRYRPTASGGTAARVGPAARAEGSTRMLVIAAALTVCIGAGVAGFVLARRPQAPAPVPPAPVAGVVDPSAPRPAPSGAPVTISQPAPEPEAPARASFEFHHRRPSAGASFYAIGWVTNDSPFTIDMPKVTAVLEDAAGKEVGTAFGFAIDAIAAGERVPASILVSDPPAHAKVVYEVAPRKASYVPPVVTGLRLEPGEVARDDFGFGFNVAGKVHNDGSEPAKFVQIRVLAKDAQGKLLGIDDSFADAEILAPGASARFDVRMLPYAEAPASFDFSVTGRPAG